MLQATFTTHKLIFKKAAKTSRNTFTERSINIIEIFDPKSGKTGIGESSPLALLSIDDLIDYPDVLRQKLDDFNVHNSIEKLELAAWPSIQFGLETALLNLNAVEGRMFNTAFTLGKEAIPINGLIWMSEIPDMYEQAIDKIQQGFKCLKFKVGAHDFDQECRLLEKIRNRFSAFKLEIRLDANGAFKADEAKKQLQELKRFEIHSIEQPLQAGQLDVMATLCSINTIPIALDEELIGLNVYTTGESLLKLIKPQYIILKPNLLGGFSYSDQWIKLARTHNIGWWATSALESNIGLNGIAQWVSTYPIKLPQGLGTGALYKKNLPSPLTLKADQLYFNPGKV